MRIELRNVDKRYGDVAVVKNLSLVLPSGKVTALLGPSGCGKTTTLRMIAGLERASGGTIHLGDDVVDDAAGVFLPPERRGLGMVFQSYALWPHKTISENVGYPLGLAMAGRPTKSRPEIDAAVLRALRKVRLDDLASRHPHQLSGGQQQRVAVARALIGDGDKAPPVLLLDEPLANLDARLREDMRAELAHIARTSGATVVAVTHDQQEAFALADSVVVLERGGLAQAGTPEDIYLRPASPFVATFGGPMTFMPARREGADVVVCGVRIAAGLVFGDSAGSFTLGVRPEWFSVDVDGDSPCIDAVVVQRLFLGREHEVVVETREGNHTITLRLPSTQSPPEPGHTLGLRPLRACAFVA